MMADAYSEIVLDHFRRPRNVGALDSADAVGCAENPVSGATATLYLMFEEGRIARANFQAQGCAATLAACSVLTELLVGKNASEAAALSRGDVIAALDGLPPTRRHAADLAIDAVRAALLQGGFRAAHT